MDQIFALKQVLEKRWGYDINVHQVFVDLCQAYDAANSNAIYRIMIELKIQSKLVRQVKVTIVNNDDHAKVKNELTQNFFIMQGLQQGNGPAPTLFSFVLKYVIC